MGQLRANWDALINRIYSRISMLPVSTKEVFHSLTISLKVTVTVNKYS